MTLSSAIKSGDASELPSRRDEDWRWTDLRGLLRTLPEPSKPFDGDPPVGPFAHLADLPIHVVNASSPVVIRCASAKPYVVALHFAALGGGAHTATAQIEVAEGAHLILLESYEGDGARLRLAAPYRCDAGLAEAEVAVLIGDTHEDVVADDVFAQRRDDGRLAADSPLDRLGNDNGNRHGWLLGRVYIMKRILKK